jgi:hypothetical protein
VVTVSRPVRRSSPSARSSTFLVLRDTWLSTSASAHS